MLESEPEPMTTALVGRLADLHAVADAVAGDGQRVVRWVWGGLFFLAVVAVGCYAFYAHSHEHNRLWLLGYLAAIAAGVVGFIVAHRREAQPKFVDSRALAEGFRVAYFWRVGGFDGDPISSYPESLVGELEWVRSVLKVEAASTGPERPDGGPLDFVVRAWIGGQARYFRKAHGRNECISIWLQRIAYGLVAAGVAVAVATFGLASWAPEVAKLHLDYLLVAIAVVPAFGGALLGFAGRLAYEARARQYGRMLALFDNARRVMAALARDMECSGIKPDLKASLEVRSRQVLAAVAAEAMAEQAQWVVMHRERPFEFIAAGG